MTEIEQLVAKYRTAKWRLRYARHRVTVRQRELEALEKQLHDCPLMNTSKETLEEEIERTGMSRYEVRIMRTKAMRLTATTALLLGTISLMLTTIYLWAAPLLPLPTGAKTTVTNTTTLTVSPKALSLLPVASPAVSLSAGQYALSIPAAEGRVPQGVAYLYWSRSPDSFVTGYRILIGTNHNSYSETRNAGNVTNVVVDRLLEDTVYYFACVSYTAQGVESMVSNETTNRTTVSISFHWDRAAIETPGYYGVTNEIVQKTNLGDPSWDVLKTFYGNHTNVQALATNSTSGFWRVRKKGQP